MKPTGDPTARLTAPPTRLRLRAARGSALALGLDQAHARGPTDEELHTLERSVLAALGTAGAAAIVTGAARAARTATLARPVAGFSIGAAKVVVALALATGAATGFWIWRQPGPASAPVTASARLTVEPAVAGPGGRSPSPAPRPRS